MPKITRDQVTCSRRRPARRPARTYIDNYLKATRGTGRLMLFACDQKVEHLNKDFYGEGIDIADAEPEHLFEIGRSGRVRRPWLASAVSSRSMPPITPSINYLVKMNSKTNLVKTAAGRSVLARSSTIWTPCSPCATAGVNIVGLGYTIYLGSEYESTMLAEAGELIAAGPRQRPAGRAVDLSARQGRHR